MVECLQGLGLLVRALVKQMMRWRTIFAWMAMVARHL